MTATGALWVAKGDPATGVKPPELASIVKAESVSSWPFAENRNLAAGSVAMPRGLCPAKNGDPAICDRTQVLGSIENPDITLLAFTVPAIPT